MKSGLKIISIALIMLTGISNAFAGPFGRQREAPPRAMRQQHVNQQEQRQEQRQQQRQQFQQPAPQPQQQPHPNPVAPPNVGNQFSGHPPEPRNPGQRMSIEDRQKLRRQINEAGQDIYTQKR